MDISNRFSEVDVSPSSTSYFSKPETELDPRLFIGTTLRPWVRNGIKRLLFEHLGIRYTNPDRWISMWLAGSGVSYQWSASRDPGDLDCLIGINYPVFRQYNQEYVGLSNEEIAKMLNESFYESLMPKTKSWEGYELTYYVNPQSDIRDINPYAAYDLMSDSWTVFPDKSPELPYSRSWEQRAKKDYDTAIELVSRYTQALSEVRSNASNTAYRINAEKRLQTIVDQAVAFYEDIHAGRKVAFSKIGGGYSDFNNYRWQAGKRSGAVHALKAIKEYKDLNEEEKQLDTYGIELPDADTLIRRAATNKRP
jgi:hypothetical protein